jgi:hypothetical protein
MNSDDDNDGGGDYRDSGSDMTGTRWWIATPSKMEFLNESFRHLVWYLPRRVASSLPTNCPLGPASDLCIPDLSIAPTYWSSPDR